MRTNGGRIVAVALAAGLLLAAVTASGCFAVRRERAPWADDVSRRGPGRGAGEDTSTGLGTDTSEQVELRGAERVEVQLRMGAGQLEVAPGASRLMDADFRYGEGLDRPEVRYELDGVAGRLSVEQRDFEGIDWDRFDTVGPYSWDLRFSEGVPMIMSVEMGAGEADLDLRGLDLRELDVSLGAGETTIDLTGARTSDLKADIQAGVGSLRVKVPSDIGVRVFGRQDGIGSFSADGMRAEGNSYVNDVYGKTPVTLEISLQRGIGEVIIEQAE